jgi:hypothetical protein
VCTDFASQNAQRLPEFDRLARARDSVFPGKTIGEDGAGQEIKERMEPWYKERESRKSRWSAASYSSAVLSLGRRRAAISQEAKGLGWRCSKQESSGQKAEAESC